LTALAVLNDDEWGRTAQQENLQPDFSANAKGREKSEKYLVQRLNRQTRHFPGYAAIRKIALAREKWTIDNGFMTPTMKLKRNLIFARYADDLEALYRGHTL
jgi:long-chain acyl-CoA synthetase